MRYVVAVILCLILSSTVLNAQSDIFEARTNYSIGETVTVTGIITSGASLGSVRYVQDASAGIALYPGIDWTAWDLEPNPGDEVNVTGVITEYNGLLEIGPNLTNVDVLSSGNPIPDALVVTPNQLNESLEGQLVVIEGATFDAGGQTIEASATYTFTSSGEEGIIYVRFSNPLVGTTLNECENNLMGIVSQFSFDGYGGYQLLPRGAADMISTSGVCDADELLGCTNPTASNYDPDATEDDGSCCYAELGDELVQLGQDIDEEIVNSQTFSLLGSFESKQYYISDNPINISDNFYEEFNALANSYGGNLLSINSFEENEFIYDSFVNQFSSSSYYYIGLFNTAPSNLCCGQGNPPGVWEWISGEDVVYTNWDINNNQPSGDELHASGSVSLGGLWIDVSGGGHSGHIILEIDLCVLFISGCMDSNACNYNPDAVEDDGSCDYSCCPGPGCCHEGTYWDEEAQQCLLDITFCSWQPDSNADGNVGIGDLLDLLSVFGDTDYDEDGVFDSVDDCVDPEACNYQANPTEPCYYIDVLGVCGGGCEGDGDDDGICDSEDDCVGVLDECGVCNGPGPTEIVIESITILYDSVFAEPIGEWIVYVLGADTVFNYFCEPVFPPLTDANIHEAVDLWISDEASAEATYGHISDWDVSSVTNMDSMFEGASSFNGDLSSWDVSSVTDMNSMYRGASNFNGDISSWDVSNVTDMRQMFQSASSFNGDLSSWDVSGVTTMFCMFFAASNFNGDISFWNVSSVTNMFEMFNVASSFNGNLSAWDVSSVTDMQNMFAGASALSEENKCAIYTSFSSNSAWPYDWSEFCPFVCGDPVSHEDYDYSTVLIGEQCWFAENCRYLPVVSPSSEGNETDPYYYVYDYHGSDVTAAQATTNYATYGVLYNYPAVMTEGICPSGWHIPSDGEWQTMEMSLGMSEPEAASVGWRGSPVGEYMKSTSGWSGTNASGFNGLPGGYRSTGGFYDVGSVGIWRAALESDSYLWFRELGQGGEVNRGNIPFYSVYGFSARCVRN